MALELTFRKTGEEIKTAIRNRISQLKERLKHRNNELDNFMKDGRKLRSYLVRSVEQNFRLHGVGNQPAPLYSKEDISSEEKEEIRQLCARIFEIEQELKRLYLIKEHLGDDQKFDLPFNDLVAYGFEATFEIDNDA